MKRFITLLFTLLISLSVSSQKAKEISRYWTSFSQNIEVQADSVKKFKVIAHVKVETSDEKARAGIWARVDNKPDQGRGFFDNMARRPIKSDQWGSYIVEGTIDSKSEKLNFGIICYNNGKFFMDKFELYIEDDAGEYQSVEIKNASFETKILDTNDVSGWSQGISKGAPYTVKEFTFSSSEDRIDGEYSVLIEGKGISTKTGTAEASIPSLGIVASIILLLVLVFSLMVYTSSTEENKWSRFGKIGFRFSFIYFLLTILLNNNGAYPFFSYISDWLIKLMYQFIPWFAEQIGITHKIVTGPSGSGDRTYDYLVTFITFSIAIIGMFIWSVLDRKRPNYKKLYYWLTTAVRYYVGLMLISYGLVKVIQLQFSEPAFYTLMGTYGDSSPMGLAWTFLGFSEGYNLFMGIAEVLAGLLLFRRTMTFGAIITLMVAMNVMAVNFFFDVPVKLTSTHLVIMTLFLLSRDLRRVMLFLVTNKPVEKLTLIQRPKMHKGINIGLNVFKGLIIAYALIYGLYSAFESKKIYGKDAPKPPLYGVYEVSNCKVNGEEIINYKDDKLWKKMRFERAGTALVRTMNDKDIYYKVEVDTTAQKIKFSSYRSGSDSFDLKYTKKGKTFNFNYIYKNDTISVTTKRLGKEDFNLTGTDFHWVIE